MKFSVGDKVDVRLDGEVKRGWLLAGFVRATWMLYVAPDESSLMTEVHIDDCIPHVPAPVVPPAPVDPLTGLTAQESERRYSARLSAFGRGEPDPFAAGPTCRHSDPATQEWLEYIGRLNTPQETAADRARAEASKTAPYGEPRRVVYAGTMGGVPVYEDPNLGENEHYILCAAPEPRPLTIEDVKVGSRWVHKIAESHCHVEDAAHGVVALRFTDGSPRHCEAVDFFRFFKPAPGAPARSFDILHDSVWAAKEDPAFKVTVVGVPLFSNGHRVLLRRGGWSDWPVSRDQFLAEYKLLHTPAPPVEVEVGQVWQRLSGEQFEVESVTMTDDGFGDGLGVNLRRVGTSSTLSVFADNLRETCTLVEAKR